MGRWHYCIPEARSSPRTRWKGRGDIQLIFLNISCSVRAYLVLDKCSGRNLWIKMLIAALFRIYLKMKMTNTFKCRRIGK